MLYSKMKPTYVALIGFFKAPVYAVALWACGCPWWVAFTLGLAVMGLMLYVVWLHFHPVQFSPELEEALTRAAAEADIWGQPRGARRHQR